MNKFHKLAILEEEIIRCKRCPRLVSWREKIARDRRRAFKKEDYWGKPVPAFGDEQARLLIVGLAPGAHGANRTGRMFTGDASGIFLYRALYKAGFANQPASNYSSDGLFLKDAFITAICRCAPPGNKPSRDEIANCQPYLQFEIEYLPNLQGVVTLGRIAFDGMLRILKKSGLAFSHGAVYNFGNELPWLIASYHPSRQNTQTGRLTEAAFDQVWQKTKVLLNSISQSFNKL